VSAAETVKPRPGAIGRFDGGAKLMTVAGGVGAVALLLTLVGLFFGSEEARERAAHSYLIGLSYWTGLAVASLIFLAIFHTAKVKWITVIRRALEVQASTVAVLALLAIPFVVVVAPKIYIWWHHAEELVAAGKLTEVQGHHMHHKQHYLNPTFFWVRQVIYWVSWIVISGLLLRWSRAQDESGDLTYTVRARKLSPGVLPLLALTITFASFDWLMSLTPLWQSTIFGVYYFAGSLWAAIAMWTLSTVITARIPNGHGALTSKEHLHNLGKFQFAFTAFWAYIAFSQFMLVWIANLPEEAPYYAVRLNEHWFPYSVALALTHFVLPFFLLIGRDIKREPRALAAVTVYVLVVQLLDIMWLVLPNHYPEGFRLAWTDVTAWVGIGGIAMAYGIWKLRGGYAVPVKDPYLPESVRYVNP
jgi:hypothetical protein